MYKRISVMVDNNPDTLTWTQRQFKSKEEINEAIETLKNDSIMLWHMFRRMHHKDDENKTFLDDDFSVTIFDCDIDELIKEEEQILFNRMLHLYCLREIGPIRPDTNVSEYSRKRRKLNFRKGTEAYYEMLCLINNPALLKKYLEKYDN